MCAYSSVAWWVEKKKLTNMLELSLSGVHFKDLINQFSQKVNFVVTGYIYRCAFLLFVSLPTDFVM